MTFDARYLLAIAVGLTAIAVPCTSFARLQNTPQGSGSSQPPVQLLDVPYLPQSEALCGGAAAAMVMRFWGESGIHADTFAHLVRAEEGGIRGTDLLRGLRERGWMAESFRGAPHVVREQLAKRRPVIALIEDRPDRYHYLVLVGWAGDRVIAHDPARAPYRVFEEGEFVESWSKAGFWTLLVLPGADASRAAEPEAGAAAPELALTGPCAELVREGIRLARVGALDGSERLLAAGAELCPADPAPLRELAGLYVIRKNWPAAERHAAAALARDEDDVHAARIVAASRFLQGDADGALERWNDLGEPAIDLVDVIGLERARFAVAAALLDLEPGELLTVENLRRARRRFAEMPGALLARVTYAPVGEGRANVQAVVVERPLYPSGAVPLGLLATRTLIERDLSVTVAGLTGGGETFTGQWRWWENRPRIGFAFEAPAPVRNAGAVWRVSAFYERQTFESKDIFSESRRGARIGAADWLSDTWRWDIEAGWDGWNGAGGAAVATGGLEYRSADDTWRASATAAAYAGAVRSAAASWTFTWQPDARMPRAGSRWSAHAGMHAIAAGAPAALWYAAGSEPGVSALLRAHPMLADGVVRRAVFGRTLAHGTVEWQRWMPSRVPAWRIAPAVFVDIARAGHTRDGFDRRLHVDAGVGLRLGLPGAGALRVDAARGLRDGEMALSFGWMRP